MILLLLATAAIFVAVFAVGWALIERRATRHTQTDSRRRESALINRLAAAMQQAEEQAQLIDELRSRTDKREQTA